MLVSPKICNHQIKDISGFGRTSGLAVYYIVPVGDRDSH
jgi:hypothetical protein